MSLQKKIIFLCAIFFVNTSFAMKPPKKTQKIHTLELIVGLMGRGKTTELIKIARYFEKLGSEVLTVFHSLELGRQQEKEKKGLYAYTGDFFPGQPVKSGKEIFEKYNALKQKGKQPDLVLIDEGQFFMGDETFIPSIREMANEETGVIVAGLEHTFLKEGFGPMPELKKLAKIVNELPSGKCVKCNNEIAAWMQRIIIEKNKNGKIIKKRAKKTDPIILVGKEDAYERRCNYCHVIPGCDKKCMGCKECIDT